MPTLLYREPGLVKGVGFDSWRRVGTPMQAVKVYNMREVDELVFLDINATTDGRGPDFELIDEIGDECFMPLAVGGGIRTVDDVHKLLRVGADKVVINTAALERPDLINEVSDRFGSQCVVVSIDASPRPDGGHEVVTRSGTHQTGVEATEWAREAAQRGAGELLVTSVVQDGTMNGYDLDLVRAVAESSSVPVIASGGAGSYDHLAQALQEGRADAVAAASMFHFTEQTPRAAKAHLHELGIPVRL